MKLHRLAQNNVLKIFILILKTILVDKNWLNSMRFRKKFKRTNATFLNFTEEQTKYKFRERIKYNEIKFHGRHQDEPYRWNFNYLFIFIVFKFKMIITLYLFVTNLAWIIFAFKQNKLKIIIVPRILMEWTGHKG